MLIGRRITVIGAGIGGLAVALACARAGARVCVLERAPEIAEIGAGLQVSPNGWAVLAALGITGGKAGGLAALPARAVRLRDFRRGAEVFAMPLPEGFALVHRADLIAALQAEALAAGVAIRLGTEVRGVTPEDAGGSDGAVRLWLADGREEVHGLTIAADGLHSAARAHLNPRARAFFTGQVAWRALVPGAGSPGTGGLAPEAHVFMGPGRHLVRYPLRDGALTNIVAVEERDAWAAEGWTEADDPANLRAAFTDFCPEVRELLGEVHAVNLWGLMRHPVAARWHGGALVLLGDAAHPTLPFLAQGANMALEDAWVLARCLADCADTSEALARYQALRRPRTARIVEAANDAAATYHLRPGPYRAAAHAALRLAGRFAPQAVSGRFRWLHGHDVTA